MNILTELGVTSQLLSQYVVSPLLNPFTELSTITIESALKRILYYSLFPNIDSSLVKDISSVSHNSIEPYTENIIKNK